MAFTNRAVLSCSKCLCFSRETLQEGNFPLRGCDLAQLGLGEGGKGHAVSCLQRMWTFLRSVRKVGAGAWKGRAALHPGGESWHSALLGGGGGGPVSRSWEGRELDSPHRGRRASVLTLLHPLASGSRAFHTLGLDSCCGHQLPGPSLPGLHSPRLQDEKLGPRPSWPSASSTSD